MSRRTRSRSRGRCAAVFVLLAGAATAFALLSLLHTRTAPPAPVRLNKRVGRQKLLAQQKILAHKHAISRARAKCNYGGVPRGDGSCACSAAFTPSTNCSRLLMRPSLREGAGGFSLRSADSSIWGASPIAHGGAYYIFASKMVNHCPVFGASGQNFWLTNSVVVLGESDQPQGPYVEVATILGDRKDPTLWDGRTAHNPTVRRAADGTFVLFYTGSTYDGDAPDCAGGHPPDSEIRPLAEHARGRQQIGVATAPHPRGPWKRPRWPVWNPTAGFGVPREFFKILYRRQIELVSHGSWTVRP